jgi:hypothetical protein
MSELQPNGHSYTSDYIPEQITISALHNESAESANKEPRDASYENSSRIQKKLVWLLL